MTETPYDTTFYTNQVGGSLSSAEVVVPLVLKHFPVKSAVDVGCGVGGWLRCLERNGVTDYFGFDGDYIPLDMLHIPEDRFQAADLSTLDHVGRRFDLAVCLEVAEHLPASSAERLVATLVKAAPVVLFSAAIPNQGGTAHINEQPQYYWGQLFQRNGYIAVDCIRPEVYGDERVEWWYRQNAIVYCQPEKVGEGFPVITQPFEFNRIEPGLVENLLMPSSGTDAVKRIREALPVLGGAIKRRMVAR
jgi:SAM-dependent methyltransferase